jgi:hypothetical protein
MRNSFTLPLRLEHRKDIEPSFYGDPVGHWEGDTPVIGTTNFKRWENNRCPGGKCQGK